MSEPGYETPSVIVDLLERLLDESVERHHDQASDETMIYCKCCDSWEDHKDDCPIPRIDAFLSQPTPVTNT